MAVTHLYLEILLRAVVVGVRLEPRQKTVAVAVVVRGTPAPAGDLAPQDRAKTAALAKTISKNPAAAVGAELERQGNTGPDLPEKATMAGMAFKVQLTPDPATTAAAVVVLLGIQLTE